MTATTASWHFSILLIFKSTLDTVSPCNEVGREDVSRVSHCSVTDQLLPGFVSHGTLEFQISRVVGELQGIARVLIPVPW
jgi:hypothetical protein